MYFICRSLCWLPAAQPARWIVHPIVVGRRENRQQSQLFISIPRAARKGNDAPAPAERPAEGGLALSHTKPEPPNSIPASGTNPPEQRVRDGTLRVPHV